MELKYPSLRSWSLKFVQILPLVKPAVLVLVREMVIAAIAAVANIIIMVIAAIAAVANIIIKKYSH